MKQKGFYAERQDNEMQSTIQVYSWLHQFKKLLFRFHQWEQLNITDGLLVC